MAHAAARQRALAALLRCRTHKQAAKKAGISERTLRRWLAEEAFHDQYRTLRRLTSDHAIGLLQGAAARAVATLVRNLTCGKPAAEIRAAVAILQQGLVGAELTNLSEEIEALQRRLNQRGKAA